MGELIRGVETPRIPGASDNMQSAAHKESHEHTRGHIEALEEEIAQTRSFILDKYNIPLENVIVEPVKDAGQEQRKIRAFSMLVNKENPALSFYAEGHMGHVVLNNMIMDKFGNQIGAEDIADLVDEDYNYKEPWVFRKGFLDPFHSGFSGFPSIRKELLGQVKTNQEMNGISDEQMEQMENGNGDLPNWFLSADSTRKH